MKQMYLLVKNNQNLILVVLDVAIAYSFVYNTDTDTSFSYITNDKDDKFNLIVLCGTDFTSYITKKQICYELHWIFC